MDPGAAEVHHTICAATAGQAWDDTYGHMFSGSEDEVGRLLDAYIAGLQEQMKAAKLANSTSRKLIWFRWRSPQLKKRGANYRYTVRIILRRMVPASAITFTLMIWPMHTCEHCNISKQ